jgi:hypothetical protein
LKSAVCAAAFLNIKLFFHPSILSAMPQAKSKKCFLSP